MSTIGPFHLMGGVCVWKSHFWGVVCIGILWSLRFFWGVRQKFLNFWGVCVCVGNLIFFFLRGSNFIDLVHGGGGGTLNGMANIYPSNACIWWYYIQWCIIQYLIVYIFNGVPIQHFSGMVNCKIPTKTKIILLIQSQIIYYHLPLFCHLFYISNNFFLLSF